jgi:hypothetical protein
MVLQIREVRHGPVGVNILVTLVSTKVEAVGAIFFAIS